jgi:DNA-binding transcriptional MerR regulator
MSLRKSPQLTPALLAAARHNAQHSTGPRSPAAKQNVKLNALKHGAYVRDENRHQAMQALGEDPQEFENLKQELMSAFGPGDALWEKQIEDLTWLYCRRKRLERAEEGLKRRALQAIDDWQHRRQQEMARVTFDASQHEMLDVDLSGSTDRGVALRKILSFLELVREEVKQRTFRPRQYAVLESLYRGTVGWRQALIFSLLHRFGDPMYLDAQQADEEEQQYLRKIGFGYEPPGEPEYQELLRLLEEEIASVREEFAYAEKANEERAAIERDACLAPEGETWRMMLRQEGALDRSIDRKVRILLRLRKESSNLPIPPAGQDVGAGMENLEEAFDSDIVSEDSQGVGTVEDIKLKERSGNVVENKGPAFSGPEQSGNVVENKGSCALKAGMFLKTNEIGGLQPC